MNYLRVNTLKPQGIKPLNNENGFNARKKAAARSSVCYANTFREFGKDLSNGCGLTVNTLGSNDNYHKTSDLVVKYTKSKRLSNKNCLLQKLKNYNVKKKVDTSMSFILTKNDISKRQPQPMAIQTEVIPEWSCSLMEVDEDKPVALDAQANVQQCSEYINDIFSHLKEIEFDHLARSDYMSRQSDINEKMRGILIDWLIDVHLKFKLQPETMFLTVNIIDRYLQRTSMDRTRLQLVGVSSMLIACKYEEIYSPEIKDFVYMTDKAYTKEEMIKMENDILGALEYNLTVPSSLRYLELYQHFMGYSESEVMYARYLLELCLIDYRFLKYNPNLIATCSMSIAMKTHGKSVDALLKVSGYSVEALSECGKDLLSMVDNAEELPQQAVRKKYLMPRFLEVARIKVNPFDAVTQELMTFND